MRLIEQDSGDARQFRIVEQGRNEDRLGHHQHAGLGRTFAVQPRQITDGLTRRLAQQFRHSLRRGPRRNPARRQHDNAAGAPRFSQQGRGDRRRLARPRWGNQDGR